MARANLDDLSLPTISCVIPTYRRPRSLRRLLDILADQKHTNFDEMDVVAVNDGSHSPEYEQTIDDDMNLPYRFVYVTRSRREDDRPACDACINQAVKLSQGEIVLILDDGLIIDDHTVFIHRLYHMFLKKAAIYPYEVYPDRSNEIQNPHPFLVSAPFPSLIDVFVTMGGNSMPREAWDAVGGLDESYDGSFGSDDRDMAIRLHRIGVSILWVDGITRLNEDSETGGSWTLKWAEWDDHRNGKLFDAKWPEYVGHRWGV